MDVRVSRPRSRWLLAVLLVASLAAGSCSDSGHEAAETSGTEASAPTDTVGADGLHGLTRDPPLQVGDQSLPEVGSAGDGSPFAFRAPPGGLLVVYFGYTQCPDFCPTTLVEVEQALAQLGPEADRVSVAMVTVDPERDTVEVLGEYVEFFVEDGHALRTEDFDRLHAVEEAFLASSELVPSGDSDEYEVVHTTATYVVDDEGTVVAEWPFGTSREAMSADLGTLLAERPATN